MKLHHPLWTHAPAVSLFAFMLVAFRRAWPLPDPAPVHFGASGLPDRFGESWEMLVVFSVVSIVAIGVSVAIDETWVRQERLRKRFNWFAAFDEIGLAFLAALTLDYLAAVAVSPYVLHLSWGRTVGLVAGSVLLALLLERWRPFRPMDLVAEEEDASSLRVEVVARLGEGGNWAYWEAHNPRYTKWYFPVFGAGLVALGISSWGDNLWAPPIALAAGAVVFFLFTGGFRVSVTPARVLVRAGLLGLPLLRLKTNEVAEAEVHSFSALADFGGYGIRRNEEMLAFVLEGNTGVKVTTTRGKRYLIGSKHPNRLASVIQAACRA